MSHVMNLYAESQATRHPGKCLIICYYQSNHSKLDASG